MSFLEFYVREDRSSASPPLVQILTSALLEFLLLIVVVSIFSDGPYVSAFLFILGTIFFACLPQRIRFGVQGIERRNVLGRNREFREHQRRALWGARCAWSEVKRFDRKKNRHRHKVRMRIGEERLVFRAKRMPTIEIHSAKPAFSSAFAMAEAHLPPGVFQRPSLLEKAKRLREKVVNEQQRKQAERDFPSATARSTEGERSGDA